VENIRKYYAFLVASENKTKPLETIPNGQSSDEPTPLGPSL
jgi:hypothetical protein